MLNKDAHAGLASSHCFWYLKKKKKSVALDAFLLPVDHPKYKRAEQARYRQQIEAEIYAYRGSESKAASLSD